LGFLNVNIIYIFGKNKYTKINANNSYYLNKSMQRNSKYIYLYVSTFNSLANSILNSSSSSKTEES
jgi:hypothetical protein